MHDSSLYRKHGTIYGAPWVLSSLNNYALSFDGSNGRVEIGDLGVTGDWTIKFWALTDTFAPIIQYPVGIVSSCGIFMGYSEKWGFWDGAGIVYGNVIALRVKYHFVVTKSGTTYSLYRNGILENSGILSNKALSDIKLGVRSDYFWYLSGQVEKVKIYSRVLNAEEINLSYQEERNT